MESSFLNGKVLKHSLPVFELPLAAEAPTLKRLRLPQGELAQLYDDDSGIRYLACIELCSGSVRGNHYHKIKEERLYVIQGQILLVVEDIDAKAREVIPLKAGDLAIIPTRIAHAFQVTASGQAIEFSTARFDAVDIHRFPLIEAT